jgi:Asp/Glu/hydantoin racemase
MTMTIRALTPIDVPPEELRRRQERYDALCPPGVRVELFNLVGTPRQLDSEQACRDSERLAIAEAVRTDPARFDAVMIDCVLDPGLEQIQERAAVPAFGILKLCAGTLAAAGHRFGAVARNRAIADELQARITDLGYRAAFDRVAVLDLSLEDIHDTARWNAVLGQAAAQFAGTGTSVLINGCSAVEVLPSGGSGVAVVDPTAFALDVLGLTIARRLPLPRPGWRAQERPARAAAVPAR